MLLDSLLTHCLLQKIEKTGDVQILVKCFLPLCTDIPSGVNHIPDPLLHKALLQTATSLPLSKYPSHLLPQRQLLADTRNGIDNDSFHTLS